MLATIAGLSFGLTAGASGCYDRDASVTASIGMALLPEDSDDPDELMRLADEAMYTAKRSGKNGTPASYALAFRPYSAVVI